MRLLTFVAVAMFWSASATAKSAWRAEFALGGAYDFRADLEIEQGSYSEEVAAKYSTRAFEDPPYYSVRLARRFGETSWELQLVHHKLHLENEPAAVDSLSVSHGLNLITINRRFDRGGWIYRVGAGPVLTHAEADVNGATYDGPYELCGLVLMTSVGRELARHERWALVTEVASTLAYAEPSPRGTPSLQLTLWNAAVHLQVGVAFDF